MPEPGCTLPECAYFLADAHLGLGTRESNRGRERDLLAFFDRVGAERAALYVMGDLFDFWFEYRHAIPKRFVRVLLALGELRRAGIPVTYIGGNHDFWIGEYLAREMEVAFADHPLPLKTQSRTILLAHGDGLGPGDRGYKLLKHLLRNPAAQVLFRCIPPDVGIPVASAVSLASRRHSPRSNRSDEELWRTLGQPWFRQGYDAVVLAHFHRVVHRRTAEGDFLILGDWIDRRTVARLERGQFALFEFGSGGGAGGGSLRGAG